MPEIDIGFRPVRMLMNRITEISKDFSLVFLIIFLLMSAFILITNREGRVEYLNSQMQKDRAIIAMYSSNQGWTPRVDDLDDVVYNVNTIASKFNLDPYLVYAVIAQESNYDKYAINRQSHDYGFMQINACWRGMQVDDTNLTDNIVYKPYYNIWAGCYILSEGFKQAGTIEGALQIYNGCRDMSYSHVVINRYGELCRMYHK